MTTAPISNDQAVAFIGGGNMASAIIGGLLRQGTPASRIQVVEPLEEQRARLVQQFGIEANAGPGAWLSRAGMVVWAVKPQTFKDAALQGRLHTQAALHLSVAAGIRSGSIAHWLGSERVVRAMPNTPALIGQGVTALFGRDAVMPSDRFAVQDVIQTTGEYVWLDNEAQLDAVTALSGSGPAYVFYFIEAMVEAGVDMGLSRQQAHQLATATFVGSSALAKASSDTPQVLRARVTSSGGTTQAAMISMEQDGVKSMFIRAMQAAQQRARELGDEFGSAQVL